MARTVCVVEDEALVRLDAVLLLEEAGFEVADFACADAAVLYLEEHAANVVMVFTDVRLPGKLDGIALAQLAAASWPWMKLVVTSGTNSAVRQNMPPNAVFLPKPWLPTELLARAG